MTGARSRSKQPLPSNIIDTKFELDLAAQPPPPVSYPLVQILSNCKTKCKELLAHLVVHMAGGDAESGVVLGIGVVQTAQGPGLAKRTHDNIIHYIMNYVITS